MARATWIVIGLMSLFVAKNAGAEFRVSGDTLHIVGGTTDPHTAHFQKIVGIKQETLLDFVDVDGSVPGVYPLLLKLKHQILQGIQFKVSRSKAFAVVMSFYCSVQLPGAEQPYVCQSTAMVVDPEGRVVSKVEGNYLFVEVHDSRPYFILKQSSCCDSAERSVVYKLTGEKVCEIPDHRDKSWATRNTLPCRRSSDGREVRLDLEDRGLSP